ncbi:hypothetical protein CDL12_14760 [Handroanthus impetiginosus]|uniref:VASt domain-containing protein n=1 Tax=Handroanthus impetiginosus TaxID=429701 RepID=A0A2G9H528_9LAMI|nr:hypothetical protein CDL12_14760 [Handroanthus impetiginosus]
MLEADKKEEPSPPIDYLKGKEQSTLLDITKEKQQPALLESVKEKEQSALHTDSSSVRGNESQSKIPEQVVATPKKFQPFIKEEMLTRVYNDVFPCAMEQFFKLVLDDDSTFTMEFHTAIKDFNIAVGQWCTSDEYSGQVRKVTYTRSSKYAMCDPEMRMTESQHVVLSADKKTLVFEISLVTEGVPFASCFENHAKWTVGAKSQSSCTLDIGFGIYFKKWCVVQSKIKAIGLEENKIYYKTMSDATRSYIMSRISNTEIDSVATPVAIQENK